MNDIDPSGGSTVCSSEAEEHRREADLRFKNAALVVAAGWAWHPDIAASVASIIDQGRRHLQTWTELIRPAP